MDTDHGVKKATLRKNWIDSSIRGKASSCGEVVWVGTGPNRRKHRRRAARGAARGAAVVHVVVGVLVDIVSIPAASASAGCALPATGCASATGTGNWGFYVYTIVPPTSVVRTTSTVAHIFNQVTDFVYLYTAVISLCVLRQ